MTNLRQTQQSQALRVLIAGALLFALNGLATAASINFGTDPFEGTTVRHTPGRQVVGGEFFISFQTGTEAFVFDASAFGMSELRFANGPINSVPFDANVIVLLTTDNDDNPLTPFGAGNAADLLAGRITVPGPGLFVYFNQSLNLPRLVYSDNLSSNTADLKILARMLDLNGLTSQGQGALSALPAFSGANFALSETSAVPEPSSLVMLSGGITLMALVGIRRAARLGVPANARN
jgi:hypothetical protein